MFQWLGGQTGALEDSPANTVEFTIEPDGGGVLLTVREQSFAGLSAVAAERRKRFEENSQGWVEELAVAKTLAEAGRGQASAGARGSGNGAGRDGLPAAGAHC